MLPLAFALLIAAPQADLATEIAAADARLFHVFFEECDPAKLASMVTDDIEFYHDKDGLVFTSSAAMIAGYTKQCEGRKAPDSWRSRRELVPGSMHVEPVPGYGAIEEGDHVFYERQGDGPEKLVGRAHFVQVWKKAPDGWRVSRILSYAHRGVN
ncbi:MAG: nuclear transport factor 2 family protein [Sphingomonas sp.]